MPSFSFRGAALEDQAGKRVRLERAESDLQGAGRTPLRLRLVAKGNDAVIIEMSRKEAYAFSEWLDDAVTQRSN